MSFKTYASAIAALGIVATFGTHTVEAREDGRFDVVPVPAYIDGVFDGMPDAAGETIVDVSCVAVPDELVLPSDIADTKPLTVIWRAVDYNPLVIAPESRKMRKALIDTLVGHGFHRPTMVTQMSRAKVSGNDKGLWLHRETLKRHGLA